MQHKPYILTALFAVLSHCILAQWTVLNLPSAGRYDDVFFINDSTGWAAAGNASRIWKTRDAGNSWETQLVVSGDYMRSIGFANEHLGFCGSLAGKFYRTTDGGLNWENIAVRIQPPPPGVCAISVPDSVHIFAAGKWKGPAFLLKSTDAGETWESVDLSAYAAGFNEVLFLNKDTGFVAGKSARPEEGGIILYTVDGGVEWEIVYKTMVNGDYVWKIQTPDGIHFYASVEGLPSSGNVRMLRSADKGKSWELKIVSESYTLSQTVGFLDSLRGWTGGSSRLFETNDGGESWAVVSVGSNYNRFRRMGQNLAYLAGDKIYRYQRDYPTKVEMPTSAAYEPHVLKVSPVPLKEFLKVEVELTSPTDVLLWIIDSGGKIRNRLLEADNRSGKFEFEIPASQFMPGHYFVVLKSNSGIQYKEILR